MPSHGRPVGIVLLLVTLVAGLWFVLRPSDGDGAASRDTVALDEGIDEAVPRLEGRASAEGAAAANDERVLGEDEVEGADSAFPGGAYIVEILDPGGSRIRRGDVEVRWWRPRPKDTESEPNRLEGNSRASAERRTYGVRNGIAKIPRLEGLPIVRFDAREVGLPTMHLDPFARNRTDLLQKTHKFVDAQALGGNVRISVTLDRGLMVHGRVLDAEGEPGDEATVKCMPITEDGQLDPSARAVLPCRATRSGHYAFGRLPPGRYSIEASYMGEAARVLIEGKGTLERDIVCGALEGPYLQFQNDDGRVVELGNITILPIKPEADPVAPTPRRARMPYNRGRRFGDAGMLALPPEYVGQRVEIWAETLEPAAIFTWRATIQEGGTILSVPEFNDASIAWLGGASVPRPKDRELDLTLTSVAEPVDGSLPTIQLRRRVSLEDCTVRVPRGRYDLRIDSRYGEVSSAVLEGAIVSPGTNRIALPQRRDLRVRVVGAVDIKSLIFFVDGSRGSPHPQGQYRVEGDVVVFSSVDSGPRLVRATWQGIHSVSGGALPPLEVRKQCGESVVEGSEGVLQIVQGEPIQVQAPAWLKTFLKEESGQLRGLNRIRLFRDGKFLTSLPLLPGKVLGFADDVVVTVALPAGRYGVSIEMLSWVLALAPEGKKPARVRWFFNDVSPGDRPLVLSQE